MLKNSNSHSAQPAIWKIFFEAYTEQYDDTDPDADANASLAGAIAVWNAGRASASDGPADDADARLMWAISHHEDAFLAYAEATNQATFGLPYETAIPRDQAFKFLRERIDQFRKEESDATEGRG